MTEKDESKKKSLHPGWVVLIVFVCLALALALGLALWRKLSPNSFANTQSTIRQTAANTFRRYYSPSAIKRRREQLSTKRPGPSLWQVTNTETPVIRNTDITSVKLADFDPVAARAAARTEALVNAPKPPPGPSEIRKMNLEKAKLEGAKIRTNQLFQGALNKSGFYGKKDAPPEVIPAKPKVSDKKWMKNYMEELRRDAGVLPQNLEFTEYDTRETTTQLPPKVATLTQLPPKVATHTRPYSNKSFLRKVITIARDSRT